MTHCTEGALQGYLDGELRGAEGEAVARHLQECAQCRQMLESRRTASEWAGAQFETLAAAPAAPVDADGAWRRLRTVWGAGSRRRRGRPGSWAVAAAAVAAVAIGTTTISPLRALAAGVLQVFRPQQVQVVTVTSADLQQMGAALATAAGQSTLDVRKLAQVHVTQSGKPATMDLAQARGAVSFDLTVPSNLPAGYRLSSVRVLPASQVQISGVQVGQINGLLASLGETAQLPTTVAGATFVVQEPASALVTYASGSGGPAIEVGEAQTPTLEVPANVNMTAVRQALLQLPFLPAGLRSQLEAITNWQTTAVLPQVSGLSQGVTVGNAQGVFITPQAAGQPATLAWIAGGVFRAVRGNLSLTQANAIAHSMS
jgi:anti-sigma factor RsiW